ncbi:MAG: phosphate transporter substrate-binding protein [Gammaproteobacteria bacterium]|jgi:hypothetical protein|nr:phosphate transporter substrate-binding protein [Gammaproteobacteria bacterium]
MYARSMKTLSAALLFVASVTTHAADLYVICNPGVSIAAADVRDVFLGDKQFSGTVKLLPLDNAGAQQMFLQTVLKMDAAKYSTAWTKKSFRDGLNPPAVAGSDAEALAYVKRTPGACSYISLAAPTGVVVIAKY